MSASLRNPPECIVIRRICPRVQDWPADYDMSDARFSAITWDVSEASDHGFMVCQDLVCMCPYTQLRQPCPSTSKDRAKAEFQVEGLAFKV